jgi:hypothetical protein
VFDEPIIHCNEQAMTITFFIYEQWFLFLGKHDAKVYRNKPHSL